MATSYGMVAGVILQDRQACLNNFHRRELPRMELAMPRSFEMIPPKVKSLSPISNVKSSPLPVSIFPSSSSSKVMMAALMNF